MSNQHPIVAAAHAAAAEADRSRGAMTLGQIRDALKDFTPETPVALSGTANPSEWSSPSALHSYRGFYSRLAFDPTTADHAETVLHGGGEGFNLNAAGYGWYQPGASEVAIAQPATAGEVVKALDLADGVEFEGYKGGQFAMDSDTLVHVASYSNCGEAVVAVTAHKGTAVLLTAEVDW